MGAQPIMPEKLCEGNVNLCSMFSRREGVFHMGTLFADTGDED